MIGKGHLTYQTLQRLNAFFERNRLGQECVVAKGACRVVADFGLDLADTALGKVNVEAEGWDIGLKSSILVRNR